MEKLNIHEKINYKSYYGQTAVMYKSSIYRCKLPYSKPGDYYSKQVVQPFNNWLQIIGVSKNQKFRSIL